MTCTICKKEYNGAVNYPLEVRLLIKGKHPESVTITENYCSMQCRILRMRNIINTSHETKFAD